MSTNNEKPSPTGANGRQPGGRFGVGNKFAKGNPLAARVQRLRSALLKAVNREDVKAIVEKLVEQAKAGDTTAAALLLNRCLGPVESLDLLARVEEIEAKLKESDHA